MTHSIPKPEFPQPRARRSSIGQAAMASRSGLATDDADRAQDAPAAAAPDTAAPSPSASTSPTVATPAQAPARPRTATPRSGGVAASKRAAEKDREKRLAASKDILLSLPEDLKDRMVNTITWTQPHTGIGTQQKFIRKAISELCDRLERQFNNSQPYPPPAEPEE